MAFSWLRKIGEKSEAVRLTEIFQGFSRIVFFLYHYLQRKSSDLESFRRLRFICIPLMEFPVTNLSMLTDSFKSCKLFKKHPLSLPEIADLKYSRENHYLKLEKHPQGQSRKKCGEKYFCAIRRLFFSRLTFLFFIVWFRDSWTRGKLVPFPLPLCTGWLFMNLTLKRELLKLRNYENWLGKVNSNLFLHNEHT